MTLFGVVVAIAFLAFMGLFVSLMPWKPNAKVEMTPSWNIRMAVVLGVFAGAFLIAGLQALVAEGIWPGLLFLPFSVPLLVSGAFCLAAGLDDQVFAKQIFWLIVPLFLVAMLIAGTTGALHGEAVVSFFGFPIHLERTLAGRVATALAWDAIVLVFAWCYYHRRR